MHWYSTLNWNIPTDYFLSAANLQLERERVFLLLAGAREIFRRRNKSEKKNEPEDNLLSLLSSLDAKIVLELSVFESWTA